MTCSNPTTTTGYSVHAEVFAEWVLTSECPHGRVSARDCYDCIAYQFDAFAEDYAPAAMSKAGCKKGGLARAAALSPERRHEIATKAAKARWGRAKK